VKNYQRLGYISYEATTSTWVTFSYELTGRKRDGRDWMINLNKLTRGG
jgi:hypothetical protein